MTSYGVNLGNGRYFTEKKKNLGILLDNFFPISDITPFIGEFFGEMGSLKGLF